MRQTVVGVFDSYTDACAAQQSLIDGGFSQADISIYAMSTGASSVGGPRVYGAGGADVRPRQSTPVFDQLEQLFARLFPPGGYPPETEEYREVIRRGGAILSADVSDVQVDLACEVMRRAGATDIGERAKAWRTGASDQGKEEPIRGSVDVHERSSTYSSGQTDSRHSPSSNESPVTGHSSMQSSEPMTPGGALEQRADSSSMEQRMPGSMQQMSTRTEAGPTPAATESVPTRPSGAPSSYAPGVDPTRAPTGTSAGLQAGGEFQREGPQSAGRAARTSETDHIGDPIMGTPLDDDAAFDDEFLPGDDPRAKSGAPGDDYQRAYTHGATFRQDERYRGRDWQEVEPSAREQWESRYPESAWERFKTAVRHGWERVKH
jgi:hypothetical protein